MPYICLYIALCDSEALPMPNHTQCVQDRNRTYAVFTHVASEYLTIPVLSQTRNCIANVGCLGAVSQHAPHSIAQSPLSTVSSSSVVFPL
jgi:hypothetical protein